MKIYLTCPECGNSDWAEITDCQTLETSFQCKHCKTLVQPEEMSSATEDSIHTKTFHKTENKEVPSKYYILEKYIPQEDLWYFEACYNANNKYDLNAMVLAAYELGRFKCCGEKGQCVRIVPSDTHVDCFSPAGYPKQN